jgi:hypothetical protein
VRLGGIFALQHQMCIIPAPMLEARGDTSKRCARIVVRGWGVLLATATGFAWYIGRDAPFPELKSLRGLVPEGVEEKIYKAGGQRAVVWAIELGRCRYRNVLSPVIPSTRAPH